MDNNSNEELKKLMDSIDTIDENNDGIIQKEELKNALINNPDFDDQMKDLSNETIQKVLDNPMLPKEDLKEMVEKDIILNKPLKENNENLSDNDEEKNVFVDHNVNEENYDSLSKIINDVDTINDNEYGIDLDIIKGIVILDDDKNKYINNKKGDVKYNAPKENLNVPKEIYEKDYLNNLEELIPETGIILSSITPNGNIPIGSFVLSKFVDRDGKEVKRIDENTSNILVEFEEIELSSDETVKTKENGRKIYMPLSMFIKLFMNKGIAECDGVKNAHKLTDIMGESDEKTMLLLQQAASILMKSGNDPLNISEFVSMSLDDTGAFCEAGGEQKANIDYSIMPFTYGLRKRLYKQRDNEETKPKDTIALTHKYNLEKSHEQESLNREGDLFPGKELGPEIYQSPDKDFEMKHTM